MLTSACQFHNENAKTLVCFQSDYVPNLHNIQLMENTNTKKKYKHCRDKISKVSKPSLNTNMYCTCRYQMSSSCYLLRYVCLDQSDGWATGIATRRTMLLARLKIAFTQINIPAIKNQHHNPPGITCFQNDRTHLIRLNLTVSWNYHLYNLTLNSLCFSRWVLR